jgi:hypothetical protein
MKKRILTTFAVLALMAGAAVASAESGTVIVSGGTLAETITAVSLAGVTLDGTDQTTTDTTNAWTAEDATGTGAGWHLTIAATDFASTSDNVQEVYTDGVNGTFTLTYDTQTTAAINEDDTAATVETRIEALSNVTDAGVSGTGVESDPWVIVFITDSGSGTMTSTDTTLVSTVRLATIDISQADQQFQITLADADVAVVAGNTKPTSSVTTKTDIGDSTVTFLSAAQAQGMGDYTLNPDLELEVRAEVHATTYTSTITVTVVTAP